MGNRINVLSIYIISTVGIIYSNFFTEPDIGVTPMHLDDFIMTWSFITVVFIVYWNKHKPGWNKVWNLLVMAGWVLILTLGANYAKKSIKEWWKKD